MTNEAHPMPKRLIVSLVSAGIAALGIAMALSGKLMAPYVIAPAMKNDAAIQKECVTKLAGNAPAIIGNGRVTIEFSEQALAVCEQRSRQEIQTFLDVHNQTGNWGIGMAALGLALIGAGYCMERKSPPPGPKGPSNE